MRNIFQRECGQVKNLLNWIDAYTKYTYIPAHLKWYSMCVKGIQIGNINALSQGMYNIFEENCIQEEMHFALHFLWLAAQ